jgi:hypothetical protein
VHRTPVSATPSTGSRISPPSSGEGGSDEGVVEHEVNRANAAYANSKDRTSFFRGRPFMLAALLIIES